MSLLYIFDLLGTFFFAISGALMGARKKMDLYGMFFLAFVTGVGGGTLRDMMLGRIPPFVFKDVNYLVVVLLATATVFFMLQKIEKKLRLLNIADALGLGVFTCIGASIALSMDVIWYGVILFGVMTATFGGMIRDVLAQEVPFVLQKEVYASASLAGGVIFLVLDYFGISLNMNIITTAISVSFIRIISIRYDLQLPKI